MDSPQNNQPTEQPKQPVPNSVQAPSPISDVDSIRLKPEKHGVGSRLAGVGSLLQLIIGALLVAFIINRFVFQSYEVFGRSMTPTLQEQDRLVISKLGKSWSTVTSNDYIPDRGTIIVFKSPRDPNIQLIKRVIGLPGERVVVEDGSITVFNDQNPQGFNPDIDFEADLTDFTTGNKESLVSEGELFVSGDNRSPGGSLDSRNELGLVPADNIVGELVVRLLPIGDASVF